MALLDGILGLGTGALSALPLLLQVIYETQKTSRSRHHDLPSLRMRHVVSEFSALAARGALGAGAAHL